MTTLNRHLVAQRVRTVLAAATSLTGVTIVTKAVDMEAREVVIVGSASSGDWSIRSFKVGSWEDNWTLTVEVSVHTPGATLAASESRCMAIVGAIVDALLADPGLTTPTAIADLVGVRAGADNASMFDGPRSGVLPGNSGFGSSATIGIPFHARHC